MSILCPLPLEPSPRSTSPLYVVTEYCVELPVLYSEFPLPIYFTCGSIYVSISSLNLSHPLLPILCPKSVLYVCVSLLCKWVHQYHFSRFHTYALIYDILSF